MDEFLNFLSVNYIWILIALIVDFVLAGIIIANFSYENFIDIFEQSKNLPTNFNGSAFDLACFISYKKFRREIGVNIFEKTEKTSNGCYIPAQKTVNISNQLANSNSVSSIAIVAHEFGHAIQHYEKPNILQRNFALTKLVKILGFLNWPLFILAIVFVFLDNLTISAIFLALIILFFVIALCLKFATIKVEKDASKRAISLLKELNLFSEKELNQIKKLLKSAKGTYIGDFFRALFSWTGLTKKTKIF